jgi:archaellum component FlaC
MHFDRESTVVITKINNLSESVLTHYCQNYGKILRIFIKSAAQTRSKEPYALIKFADELSVRSILSNRNHTINGTHVLIRGYHQDSTNTSSSQSLSTLTSLNQQNQNGQKPANYDQILQENHSLKHEIANLQKSLAEAQIYSKTAYDTFQALREKFEAEQVLTNKLKSDYADMIASYEARLKQSVKSIDNERIKDEPIDCDSQKTNLANYFLEMQVMKDRLEQAQIDLGKCQTENAILNAKLLSREQKSDLRYKELNNEYTRMKRQYDHVSSCIQDFQSKLYHHKRLKTEVKEDVNEESDDIVEVIMEDVPMMP